MTTVKIVENGDTGWLDVVSPYDPDVIATIKDISQPHREWVPGKKLWRVHGDFGPVLTEALIARGHDVVGEAPPLPDVEAFFGVKAEDDFDAKGLAADILANIPADKQSKVFRALAKALYPDLYKR